MEILLVEDHEDVAEVTQMMLEVEAHAVRVAPNGVAALEILAQWQPDLIVTDVLMPLMDGIRLTQHVRSEMRMTTPILVCAVCGPKGREDALAAGATCFLEKPYDMDTFLRMVQECGAGQAAVIMPPVMDGYGMMGQA